MELSDLTNEMNQAWTLFINGEIKPPFQGQTTFRASDIGHPCYRYHFLQFVYPEKAATVTPDLQSIFQLGHEINDVIIRRLDRLGYRLVETEAPIPKNEYNITGHVDGILYRNGKAFVVDGKGINERWFNDITDYESVRDHRSYIVRKWYAQLTIYMHFRRDTNAILALMNKGTGQMKFVGIPYSSTTANSLLEKVKHIAAEVKELWRYPPGVEEVSICKSCPFNKTACFPNYHNTVDEFVLEGTIAELGKIISSHAAQADVYSRAIESLRGYLRSKYQSAEPGRYSLATNGCYASISKSKTGRLRILISPLGEL